MLVILAFMVVGATARPYSETGLPCSQNETTIRVCGECSGAREGCGLQHPLIPPFDCPPSTTCMAPNTVCVCRDGYVFDSEKSKCILAQDCPRRCPPNEYETIAGCDKFVDLRCQVSCSRSEAQIEADPSCGLVCDAYYCACDQGFVRHDQTLKCVRREQCFRFG